MVIAERMRNEKDCSLLPVVLLPNSWDSAQTGDLDARSSKLPYYPRPKLPVSSEPHKLLLG